MYTLKFIKCNIWFFSICVLNNTSYFRSTLELLSNMSDSGSQTLGFIQSRLDKYLTFSNTLLLDFPQHYPQFLRSTSKSASLHFMSLQSFLFHSFTYTQLVYNLQNRVLKFTFSITVNNGQDQRNSVAQVHTKNYVVGSQKKTLIIQAN